MNSVTNEHIVPHTDTSELNHITETINKIHLTHEEKEDITQMLKKFGATYEDLSNRINMSEFE
jgi:hypothetical protein